MLSSGDLLDLPTYVGQVGCSFRYDLSDGTTGQLLGELTPLKGSVPTLDHDTTSTISRRVQSFTLGAADSDAINPLTDRVTISMVLGDRDRTTYPLGRYMFADVTRARYSQGLLTPATLYDEMFIVDQALEQGFNALGQPVDIAIRRLLDGLPIGDVYVDATSQTSTNSWSSGTARGSVLTELATVGDLFKPWFNNLGQLRAIRSFEPDASQLADIDLDDPPRVLRESIAESDDLLAAPNRYVVVSNSTGGTMTTDGSEEDAPPPVVGTYDVPSTAPHSIAQRGFVIPQVVEAQVTTATAAAVYARTLGRQRDVYQRVELSTPPDPRHDGYDVVRWNGLLWLETGWSMNLTPGGEMRHKMRRLFPPSGEDVLT